MHEVVDFIASIVRQKLRWLIVFAVIAVLGVAFTNGLSWTTALVVFLALFIVGGFWALTSFWLWVFRHTGRQEPR